MGAPAGVGLDVDACKIHELLAARPQPSDASAELGVELPEVSHRLGDERLQIDVADEAALAAAMRGKKAVMSALPFFHNPLVARVAANAGVHYFDLTEDVPTTQAIIELSKTSRGLMAPVAPHSEIHILPAIGGG